MMKRITEIFRGFTRAEERFSNSPILNAVRHGLTLLIPMVLIGSMALVVISFPVPAYQEFMVKQFGNGWKNTFVFVRDGTINILSLLMVVCISYCLVMEDGEKNGYPANPIIASCVSLCSFVVIFGITKSDFSISNYGVVGAFIAILVSVTSSLLFLKLSKIKALRIRAFTDGDAAVFNSALASIIPAAITILVYAVINQALSALFGISDIQTFISSFFSGVIKSISSPFLSAIFFILMIHIFWFFGIHGNNVLEPVAQSVFVPALTLNQQLISAGKAPTQIFTKTFFDTFVLMGGCGTTLCLILAIIIMDKNKNQRGIAKLSVIPSIFNINEMIIFGIPIVLNPIYIIPFLLVPVILTITSFAAMSLGLVPYTINPVEWTTPVFLSGYASTGSIAGCFLQLFNLTLGTACYMPFVKLAQSVSDSQVKNNINRLCSHFKNSEENGSFAGLLKRQDDLGSISRFLVADLKNDMQGGRISLFYQPQVDYEGNVYGVEALLRWNHRAYGYIYPPLIIELAEESQMIDELGGWIFETACHDLKKLNRLGLKDMSISVNVSAVQLENPYFVETLRDIIGQYDISPHRLKIEITEQIALASSQKVMKQLMGIKDLGIKLEMDDFGMGHSSLMYLKEYNFDTIKLDGSLVREICTNGNCRNIISSIVFLSKSMNYSVLAEYVERDDQRSILHSLGCDCYQGYLFSKALPFDELIQYIGGNHPNQADDLARLQ